MRVDPQGFENPDKDPFEVLCCQCFMGRVGALVALSDPQAEIAQLMALLSVSVRVIISLFMR